MNWTTLKTYEDYKKANIRLEELSKLKLHRVTYAEKNSLIILVNEYKEKNFKIICFNLKTFKEKYSETLNNYKAEWEDNSELSFLLEYKEFYKECLKNVSLKEPELSGEGNSKKYIEPQSLSIKEIHDNIESNLLENFEYHDESSDIQMEEHLIRIERIKTYKKYQISFQAIIKLIESEIESIESNNLKSEFFEPLKWNKRDVDLVELFTALFESNCFEQGIKEHLIFAKFKYLFGIDNLSYGDLRRRIKDRKKTNSVFIEELYRALKNWATK